MSILLYLFVVSSYGLLAQRTYTIDYSEYAKNNKIDTNCLLKNGFNIAGINHLPSRGTIFYSNSAKSLMMGSIHFWDHSTQRDKFKITEYALHFDFKKNFNYKIIANTKTIVVKGDGSSIWSKWDNLKGNSTGCSPYESVDYDWYSNNGYSYYLFFDNSFVDKQLYFGKINSPYQYFLISSAPINHFNFDTRDIPFIVYIKKIVITESSGLKLTATKEEMVCGDTQPITFTVNNPNGIDNISSYTWLIDSTHGWLYNGIQANNIIHTAGNTISLTPTCSAKSISLRSVVNFQGTAFKDTTNITIVKKLIPPIAILGPEQIFAHSFATYTTSLNANSCDYSINWSLTPMAGAFSYNGNSAEIHASGPDVGVGGRAELKATINICDTNIVVAKQIDIGYANSNDYVFLRSGPDCFNSSNGIQNFGIGYKTPQTSPSQYITGCQLDYSRDIKEVQWMIFSEKPISVYKNQGTYACGSTGIADNVGFKIIFQQYPQQPYVVTFLFRVRNFMGWGDWSVGNYFFVQNCTSSGGGWSSLTKKSGIAEIEFTKPNDKLLLKDSAKSLITSIRVLDKTGKIIQDWNFTDIVSMQKRLEIEKYLNSNYQIQIFNGIKWISNTVNYN